MSRKSRGHFTHFHSSFFPHGCSGDFLLRLNSDNLTGVAYCNVAKHVFENDDGLLV